MEIQIGIRQSLSKNMDLVNVVNGQYTMKELFQVGINCVYWNIVLYFASLYCALQYTAKSLKNTV